MHTFNVSAYSTMLCLVLLLVFHILRHV